MRAARFHSYGDASVLRVEEVSRPTPAANEVLIRVCGSSINPADIGGRQGLLRLVHARHLPHIPGYDVAGVVETCGTAVTAFLPGERVFALVGIGGGAHAEYICVAQERVARAPQRLSLTEAGTVPLAALTALQGLRAQAGVQNGQRLLVNGAAGGVGSFAVQIGKAFGCHVTGVGHTEVQDLITSLGADDVVDYTREDMTKRAQAWDVVFDAAGSLDIRNLQRVLAARAVVVSPRASLSNVLNNALRIVGPAPRYRFYVTKASGHDLALITHMFDTNALHTCIDRMFPLDDIGAAHQYFEQARTRGKVGISIADENNKSAAG